jgi:hypothetical protein
MCLSNIIFLEKLIVAKLVKTLPDVYGTRNFLEKLIVAKQVKTPPDFM